MKVEFRVQGMSCGHCEKAVRKAISAVDAVLQVSVDLPGQRISVDGVAVDTDRIAAAIDDAGYEVKGVKASDGN